MHGLADKDGNSKLRLALQGMKMVEEVRNFQSAQSTGQIPRKGGRAHTVFGGKLVLRPYGLAEEATAKAELQRVLDGQFEVQGSGQTVASQHIRVLISSYFLFLFDLHDLADDPIMLRFLRVW